MIRDSRIGKKAPNGRILTAPSRYADGTVYNKVANPAPSTYDINGEYFVYLPFRYHISLDLLREFKEILGIEEETKSSDDSENVATEKAEPEVLKVKGGRKILILGNTAVNLDDKDSK